LSAGAGWLYNLLEMKDLLLFFPEKKGDDIGDKSSFYWKDILNHLNK
jgi:hypothetical protein